VKVDHETGQTLISGMGELHLEIIVDRLLREFKVDANVGKPQVAYKETIRREVEQEGKFVRQTGGRGQFGHVWLRVGPLPPRSGFQFEDAVRGGVIPANTSRPSKRGRKQPTTAFSRATPMVDVKGTRFDGS